MNCKIKKSKIISNWDEWLRTCEVRGGVSCGASSVFTSEGRRSVKIGVGVRAYVWLVMGLWEEAGLVLVVGLRVRAGVELGVVLRVVGCSINSGGKGEIRRGLRVRVWASLRLGKKLG